MPDSLIGQTLNLFLEENIETSNSDMYLSFDAIPDESEYDFMGILTDNTKKLTIPGLKRGTYYLLIHGNTNSNKQLIKIRTEIPPFEISSINPMEGGNTGYVTLKLFGTQFDTLMNASLIKDDYEIHSTDIFFKDPTTCFAKFNLSGKQLGKFDVVIEKENGTQNTFDKSFEIVQGVPPSLITNLSSVSATRIGFTETITFTCKNGGNTDITDYVAIFNSTGNSPISFSEEGLSENLKEKRLLLQHPDSPYGTIRPGEEFHLPIYSKIGDANFKLKLSIIN